MSWRDRSTRRILPMTCLSLRWLIERRAHPLTSRQKTLADSVTFVIFLNLHQYKDTKPLRRNYQVYGSDFLTAVKLRWVYLCVCPSQTPGAGGTLWELILPFFVNRLVGNGKGGWGWAGWAVSKSQKKITSSLILFWFTNITSEVTVWIASHYEETGSLIKCCSQAICDCYLSKISPI